MPKYYEDCHFGQCYVLECGEAGKEPASEAFGDANAEHQNQEMSGFGMKLKQDCRFLHCWMSSSIGTSETIESRIPTAEW